jgi:DNA-binding transcriptional regulator/RsmH inhibitor MraZ
MNAEQLDRMDAVPQATAFFVSSTPLHIRNQNRFVIPKEERHRARLGDLVMLVGCGNRFEIWPYEEYERWLQTPPEQEE